jgi:apolipoprotein N-acyltransferase
MLREMISFIVRRSSFIVRVSLGVVSAFLLVLSFPNFNLEFLAWFALIPLLFAISGQKPLRAFLISYLAGVIFFFGTIWWLIHVTLPGMIVVVLYLSLYFGAFGMITSYILRSRKHDIRRAKYILLFFIPSLWVALELARSNLLTGFGWNILGYSQSFTPPAIQIADITGVYGVSYIIVLANTAVFFTARQFRVRDYSIRYLALASLIIYLCFAYGVYRVNNIFTGERLKVAVVQGNIPQDKKWDADYSPDILRTYESLTEDAVKEKPDLVLWPETSVPGFLGADVSLTARVKRFAASIGTPLLVGAPTENAKLAGYYNSAILFSDEARIVNSYEKLHLVPFGEYIPARSLFAFAEKFAPIPIGDFSGGDEYTVFKFFIKRSAAGRDMKLGLLKKVSFSCLICFEDIFPELARQFVKRGASFLVNITNDAWFKKTSAAYQHAQCSVFRAVENRVNVVRAANTGLSCFIDQKGRITESVSYGGQELFVPGFKSGEIVLTPARTLYTSYGDVFAVLCALFTLIIITYRSRHKGYFHREEARCAAHNGGR